MVTRFWSKNYFCQHLSIDTLIMSSLLSVIIKGIRDIFVKLCEIERECSGQNDTIRFIDVSVQSFQLILAYRIELVEGKWSMRALTLKQ